MRWRRILHGSSSFSGWTIVRYRDLMRRESIPESVSQLFVCVHGSKACLRVCCIMERSRAICILKQYGTPISYLNQTLFQETKKKNHVGLKPGYEYKYGSRYKSTRNRIMSRNRCLSSSAWVPWSKEFGWKGWGILMLHEGRILRFFFFLKPRMYGRSELPVMNNRESIFGRTLFSLPDE